MIEIREKALEKIEKAGISTTLVCVIQKGLNDNEIPEIIEYAKKWKCVR
jgi:7,8-dihydro-6-hydroxymethylpterin dimethyltransferase